MPKCDVFLGVTGSFTEVIPRLSSGLSAMYRRLPQGRAMFASTLRMACASTLLGLAAGCSSPETMDPSAIAPGSRPLPTAVEQDAVVGCAEVLVPSTLHGSPADSHVTWLVDFDNNRIEIIWPDGYSARFAPALEVLGPSGAPVLREGDFVGGSCEIGDPNGRLMDPPFLAFALECGPLPVEDCTSGRLYTVVSKHGWPARDIASVEFVDLGGDYVLRFEDGTKLEGSSSAP